MSSASGRGTVIRFEVQFANLFAAILKSTSNGSLIAAGSDTFQSDTSPEISDALTIPCSISFQADAGVLRNTVRISNSVSPRNVNRTRASSLPPSPSVPSTTWVRKLFIGGSAGVVSNFAALGSASSACLLRKVGMSSRKGATSVVVSTHTS